MSVGTTLRSGFAAAALVLAAMPALAQAPAQPPRPAPAAPAPDPALAASKAAFERLDEAERKAIQNDLIWTGDFNGVAGGEFGKRTHDAMLAFERRLKLAADAILPPPERAILKRDADAARLALRFAPITDQATGIRIGLPAALLPQRVAVRDGVVYRRADGAVTLQLLQMPPAQDFAQLFEQMRQDGQGRKVTYRLQRPDWFVVSGDEGARKFYTRLAQGPDGIRGYTFRYPADQAASLDRIMIAIANSFEPFPGSDIAANPARVPAQPSQPALIDPGLRAGLARHAISGVSIGPGRALTSAAALASCASPTVDGKPVEAAAAVIANDVAIIAVPGLARPSLPLASGAAPEAVFTLSLEEGPQRSVVIAPGRLDAASGRVASALQVGAGGAPVLDGQGRLVGLVAEGAKAQRLVAGTVPEASYPIIPAERFRAALPPVAVAAGPAPMGPGASARMMNAAAAALVEIRCAGRV